MERKYRINEIFYSLQGEGRWAGRAAIFIRFSGCNLHCPFCDTNFKEYKEKTAKEIFDTILPWQKCGFVVLTGGEPTMQVDEALINGLHDLGLNIAIESNGTYKIPTGIDWIVVSPKTAFVTNAPHLYPQAVDELKLVFDGEVDPAPFLDIDAYFYFLQPCDTGDAKRNKEITAKCVEYIKAHPKWQLSMQQQKILNVR